MHGQKINNNWPSFTLFVLLEQEKRELNLVNKDSNSIINDCNISS